MPFALEVATEAKLVDYDQLSDKDREPDANPGAKLELTMTLPNTALTMFDGFLRGMLFGKDDQGTTDGDGLTKLTNIAEKIGKFSWGEELTGYTITFDYGLAGKSNFSFEDTKLCGFVMTPKPGSVFLRFVTESPDVAEKWHGKLALLKSQTVKILLKPPVVDDSADAVE
jgi:hypothetical protein